ncbi:hypothetical protein [Candidatus Nitrosocosmicus oleophilus]|uniref:hypothetical protein n=1 Tax=Candidatus Nitrosocosmicus oleophilus TaxID=1353260 RepID=UPI0018CB001F|nr:hypothetical protein [Candidatus Nitrosocosmicus oleophilus]
MSSKLAAVTSVLGLGKSIPFIQIDFPERVAAAKEGLKIGTKKTAIKKIDNI